MVPSVVWFALCNTALCCCSYCNRSIYDDRLQCTIGWCSQVDVIIPPRANIHAYTLARISHVVANHICNKAAVFCLFAPLAFNFRVIVLAVHCDMLLLPFFPSARPLPRICRHHRCHFCLYHSPMSLFLAGGLPEDRRYFRTFLP